MDLIVSKISENPALLGSLISEIPDIIALVAWIRQNQGTPVTNVPVNLKRIILETKAKINTICTDGNTPASDINSVINSLPNGAYEIKRTIGKVHVILATVFHHTGVLVKEGDNALVYDHNRVGNKLEEGKELPGFTRSWQLREWIKDMNEVLINVKDRLEVEEFKERYDMAAAINQFNEFNQMTNNCDTFVQAMLQPEYGTQIDLMLSGNDKLEKIRGKFVRISCTINP